MQGRSSGQGGLHASAALGVVFGFAGALLDFYSAYLLLTGSAGMTGMQMTTQSGSGFTWGIGVAALGLLLAATALAAVLRFGAGRMADFGILMVVYGLVMLFIGGAMYAGLTSMTQGTLFPASGMFVVGVLMVANGALMLRSPML